MNCSNWVSSDFSSSLDCSLTRSCPCWMWLVTALIFKAKCFVYDHFDGSCKEEICLDCLFTCVFTQPRTSCIQTSNITSQSRFPICGITANLSVLIQCPFSSSIQTRSSATCGTCRASPSTRQQRKRSRRLRSSTSCSRSRELCQTCSRCSQK